MTRLTPRRRKALEEIAEEARSIVESLFYYEREPLYLQLTEEEYMPLVNLVRKLDEIDGYPPSGSTGFSR